MTTATQNAKHMGTIVGFNLAILAALYEERHCEAPSYSGTILTTPWQTPLQQPKKTDLTGRSENFPVTKIYEHSR